MTEDGSEPQLSFDGEIWRKALHLVSISIPVGLLLLGQKTTLLVIVPLAAAFVASEVLRSRSKTIRDLIYRVFGFMMRAEEIPLAPSPLRLNGATWVLLSSCIIVSLFSPAVAAASLVIGLIGDAAAALIGRRFGRHPLGARGKSIEGSIAFVAAALPAAAFVPGTDLSALAIAVLAAALVEGIGSPIDDNLSAPVAAAIVLRVLSSG